MQTLIQVFCKGCQSSLRKKIGEDDRLSDYNLYVAEHKNYFRSGGLVEIKSFGRKWNSKY